ncbi:uncharacterized protein LOC117121946 [Anneissia japonica]|uniref:uncharacterized protein LOC117121946 n=1 Tax=Anneissia japonica TaxID=1529436 RepID=UPI00142589D3|nr:uncharacterized protein LOC117121946 [Anneissia japonica]XP_033123257.1 uncharacterized protein LOC117121946 [Anneissia japonica]
MDGFDLAVLGLPMAAFGVRVVTDYLGEILVTTDDDIVNLDASTSGTAVDELVATEIHASIIDNEVSKTIQKLSNDGYENKWSCAKFLIKNIDPKCACECRIKQNVSDSTETYHTAEVSEGNQVTTNDDDTVAPGVDGLSVSTETEVSEDVYEADDESGYEISVNDGSDDESITSEKFFSMINCRAREVTKTNGNSPRKHISSKEFRPIQKLSTRVNSCNKDGVCDMDPTIVLEEKGVYQNTKEIDQIKRTQVNYIFPERRDGQGRNNYCFYNNNINDRPREKATLNDSLGKHQLDQSRQESLQSEGRIDQHARNVNTDIVNINSVSESELNEHYDSLDHSRLTTNPLSSTSSGNNNAKANSLSDDSCTQLTTEYTTHNSSWVPVKSTVEDNSEAVIRPTGKQYHSESTSSPIDRQSIDNGSEMKVITDSSAVIDIPETPKSPTRQYTVACPVIEQTSPKGKRWMKRMSLEISFVDTPPLPLTSPDAPDGPDFKCNDSTENTLPETVKGATKATTSRRTGDESSTTTRRQEHARPHPRGRFMYQFAVPRAHIRSVIGDQARVIRRLRQRTCATISVNYPRGFDGCTCTIEGTYSQVLGAVLILRQNFPQLEWSQDEPADQTAGT